MKLIALILLVVATYGASAQCSAPTNLSTTGITATAATAKWNAVSGASSYNLDYKLSSSPDWVTIANGTTSLQWTISVLDPTTSYDWRVSANCTSGASSYTQTQFTTGAIGSCAAPGGLSASNIASTTATLNWSPVSGSFSYSVEYKPVSSSSWIFATAGTAGTSVNLYSLSASTTYDWRIHSTCSVVEGSGYSYAQFTTSGSNPPPPPPSGCPGASDVSTNGTMSGAAQINLNTDVKGTIAPVGDIDYYKFTISSAGTFTVWLTTLPGNYDLALFNSNGTQIGISKNKGTRNESISVSVSPGTFYAKVYPTGSANSATSCYTLKVLTITATKAAITSASMENNMNSEFAVNLFPNPAGDQLNIMVQGSDNRSEIKVYNLMGKLVMQQGSGNTITQLNISKLPAGVYMLNVNNGKEMKAAKFVKQ
jgi:hypothetical protein